jgi:hypothetical protein
LLPNAGDCAIGEAAALLTLPLMTRPSFASVGGGVAAVVGAFVPPAGAAVGVAGAAIFGAAAIGAGRRAELEAVGVTAAGAGGRCPITASSGFNVIVHTAGASAGIVTSCVIVTNVDISTRMDHAPFSRSANVNAPCSSVTVVTCRSPFLAITVAPGTG